MLVEPKVLNELWSEAVAIYKKSRPIKYNATWKFVDAKGGCKGCCEDWFSGINVTVEYHLLDQEDQQVVQAIYGCQKNYRSIGNWMHPTLQEVTHINTTPVVNFDLRLSSAACFCLLGLIVPIMLPCSLYYCCTYEESHEQSVMAVVQLLEEGERWVDAAYAQANRQTTQPQRTASYPQPPASDEAAYRAQANQLILNSLWATSTQAQREQAQAALSSYTGEPSLSERSRLIPQS